MKAQNMWNGLLNNCQCGIDCGTWDASIITFYLFNSFIFSNRIIHGGSKTCPGKFYMQGTYMLTHLFTLDQFIIIIPPTSMFLGDEGKAEWLKEKHVRTHTDKHRGTKNMHKYRIQSLEPLEQCVTNNTCTTVTSHLLNNMKMTHFCWKGTCV